MLSLLNDRARAPNITRVTALIAPEKSPSTQTLVPVRRVVCSIIDVALVGPASEGADEVRAEPATPDPGSCCS